MTRSVAPDAATVHHRPGREPGSREPARAPWQRRFSRTQVLVAAILLALAFATFAGALVGYDLARPAGLHCIQSHGTSTCYTLHAGTGAVPRNRGFLNVYDTPSGRRAIQCYLQ